MQSSSSQSNNIPLNTVPDANNRPENGTTRKRPFDSTGGDVTSENISGRPGKTNNRSKVVSSGGGDNHGTPSAVGEPDERKQALPGFKPTTAINAVVSAAGEVIENILNAPVTGGRTNRGGSRTATANSPALSVREEVVDHHFNASAAGGHVHGDDLSGGLPTTPAISAAVSATGGVTDHLSNAPMAGHHATIMAPTARAISPALSARGEVIQHHSSAPGPDYRGSGAGFSGLDQDLDSTAVANPISRNDDTRILDEPSAPGSDPPKETDIKPCDILDVPDEVLLVGLGDVFLSSEGATTADFDGDIDGLISPPSGHSLQTSENVYPSGHVLSFSTQEPGITRADLDESGAHFGSEASNSPSPFHSTATAFRTQRAMDVLAKFENAFSNGRRASERH